MADQAADFAARQLAVSAPATSVLQQTAGEAAAPSPPELDPPQGN
jgi:hypothetical protein